MPIKGGRLGSEKGIKDSLKSNGSDYATRVPAEGELVVRFLTEPEDWWAVELHFDEVRKTSYPCTGIDEGCVGCEEGMDSNKRWFANAYDVDAERVTVIEMPRSVVKEVMKKYDRVNTVMDRDYALSKEGTGLQTRYSAEALDVSNLRGMSKMTLIDLEEFLEKMLDRAMNDEDTDVLSSSRAKSRSASRTGRGGSVDNDRRRRDIEEDDFEDDDDIPDDNEEVAPKRRPRPKTATKTAARPTSTKKTAAPAAKKRRRLAR